MKFFVSVCAVSSEKKSELCMNNMSLEAQSRARNIIYLCLEVIEDDELFVVSNIWV